MFLVFQVITTLKPSLVTIISDLIFSTNKNIMSNHGVDVTIFEKCHHNIIYGKINIRLPLPPVYIREVWDYSKANIENINKAIRNFNWTKALKSLSVD